MFIELPSPTSARERILHTAHELFYRHGIAATGIDRIIEQAGVTKVTLYRHFASKNELIVAYLAERHVLWITAFQRALQRHLDRRTAGAEIQVPETLVAALSEWFADEDFHGCAFINSAIEAHRRIPGVDDLARQHKQEMTQAITALLPPTPERDTRAQAIAMAIDGAIVRAQMDGSPEPALGLLTRLLGAL